MDITAVFFANNPYWFTILLEITLKILETVLHIPQTIVHILQIALNILEIALKAHRQKGPSTSQKRSDEHADHGFVLVNRWPYNLIDAWFIVFSS